MYNVGTKLLWDDYFFFQTESGTKYFCKLSETAPSSGVWTFNFGLEDGGNPLLSEVFETMQTLTQSLEDILDDKGITNVLVYIVGKDRDEIDKKTNVFTRWIELPWSYTIERNPEIRINGKRDSIYTNTNFIYLTKN